MWSTVLKYWCCLILLNPKMIISENLTRFLCTWDHMWVLISSSEGEGSAVCEIVHTKSESEGRPERTFQLCCRWGSLLMEVEFHCRLKLTCLGYSPVCCYLQSDELITCLSVSLSSPESRKDFLKTVHSILREKHRRQLLKTESLPLNQQYVPFGGKRLCALKGARPAINRAGKCQSVAAFTLQLQVSQFWISSYLTQMGCFGVMWTKLSWIWAFYSWFPPNL